MQDGAVFNLLSCSGQRLGFHFCIQSVERGDETLAQSLPSLSHTSPADRRQGPGGRLCLVTLCGGGDVERVMYAIWWHV